METISFDTTSLDFMVAQLETLKDGMERPAFRADEGYTPAALVELAEGVANLDRDFAELVDETVSFLKRTSETITEADQMIADIISSVKGIFGDSSAQVGGGGTSGGAGSSRSF